MLNCNMFSFFSSKNELFENENFVDIFYVGGGGGGGGGTTTRLDYFGE